MTYTYSLTTLDLVGIANCAARRAQDWSTRTDVRGEIDTVHAMVALAADHGGRIIRSVSGQCFDS